MGRVSNVNFVDSTLKYYRDLSKMKSMTPKEQHILFKRFKDGDISARNEIICRNLKFVFFIARKYFASGIQMGDLVSEGNMGLLRAVELFNDSYNTRFTTYAKYWIKAYINEAVKEGGKNMNNADILEFDRTSTEERANNGFDNDMVDIEHGDELLYEDKREDEERLDLIKEFAKSSLCLLSEVERNVILMTYGINEPVLSTEEIAKELGMSSVNVGKVRDRAMKKMRKFALENCFSY